MRDKRELQNLYRRRARFYDLSASLGFREYAYRKQAVEELRIKGGNSVVEIGCGTGLNFSLLQEKVGPDGRIIGVDLTEKMLDRARKKVERRGWKNVQLVQSDAARYDFPENLSGIISTFAISLVPEFDEVIHNGAEALHSGGHFVILDLKRPKAVPIWLVGLGVFLTKPFGVSLDLMDRHPWESISRYLAEVSHTELYGGFAYISVGKAE